jgi:tRNA threonylcarbamoyladenosine biosynthesis protein TsaB
MYILAVDTASNAGGVALSRNSELIGAHLAKIPLKYSEKLIDWVDFLLSQHEVTLEEIGCFAVACGPGSFTGLRIGIAAVKAFAQVLGRPVVGLSTLEAIAYRFRHVSPAVAPVMDARRQQVYGAIYDVSGQEPRCIHPESVARPEEWLRGLPSGDLLFAGDGAALYRSAILNLRPGSRLIESDNFILPELCQLGYLRSRQGAAGTAAEVRANYLRSADVQLKPGRRPAGGLPGARG